ncbi:MAG TPA: pectin acetylesterase-family hydrolase [Candidatus Acidoferrales bacterium]|nr:pectin acetylesterase-family hydrolase [Candidatus Acidoferrales bacterium]
MSITLWTAFRRSAVVISAVLMASSAAHAGTYATNTCVGKKLSAASTACKQVLTAWKNWEKDQNSSTRDGAISSAGTKLANAWTSAETSATAAGADCTETTVTSAAMQADLTSAVSNIMNSINAGGAPTDSSDIKCRQGLISAAITACQKMLTAEGAFVKGLKSDVGGTKRNAKLTTALQNFTTAWTLAGCTAVTTPPSDVTAELSAFDSTAVTDTTLSPTVSTAWTMISPSGPVTYNGKTLTAMCTDASQYVYFVKKGSGSDVNKLLVYYEGGGACWDYNTCSAHAETATTGPSHNPANATSGFFDLSNPANPFANWSMVFVPYCTGDVHWGNATTTYTDPSDSSKSITIHHNGWPNAQVVEKWTREHFVNPDVLFVAGSSAGGYGALLNSLYFLQDAYQASKAYVFDDAGAGVITSTFQDTNLPLWGVQSTLPTWIPGIGHASIKKLNIADVAIDAANFYNPRVDFVQYATAYDQVQTLFYALMVLGDASLGVPWWTETCDWNTKMLTNLTTVSGPNYRYYIGAGDTHTVWEFNKVYSDTMGGVTPLVDWVNAMLTGDTADWQNQQCSDCNLEPGDTNPKQGPFAADGTVSCP